MCLYAGTHPHTHILNHTGLYMKVRVSVALAVWLASPVTCQSVTVHDGLPLLRLNLPAWGHDGGQSRSDRQWQGGDPFCTPRAGGCLSMCHPEWQSGVLRPRWERCRYLIEDRSTMRGCISAPHTHVHTNDCRDKCTHFKCTYKHVGHVNTHVSDSETCFPHATVCAPPTTQSGDRSFERENNKKILILLALLKAAERMMKL